MAIETMGPQKFETLEIWDLRAMKLLDKGNVVHMSSGINDRVSQQQLDHLSLCWLQGQDEGPGPHGQQGPPLLRVLVQVSLLGKNETEQNLSVCAVKYGAIFVCSSCHQRLETT